MSKICSVASLYWWLAWSKAVSRALAVAQFIAIHCIARAVVPGFVLVLVAACVAFNLLLGNSFPVEICYLCVPAACS